MKFLGKTFPPANKASNISGRTSGNFRRKIRKLRFRFCAFFFFFGNFVQQKCDKICNAMQMGGVLRYKWDAYRDADGRSTASISLSSKLRGTKSTAIQNGSAIQYNLKWKCIAVPFFDLGVSDIASLPTWATGFGLNGKMQNDPNKGNVAQIGISGSFGAIFSIFAVRPKSIFGHVISGVGLDVSQIGAKKHCWVSDILLTAFGCSKCFLQPPAALTICTQPEA